MHTAGLVEEEAVSFRLLETAPCHPPPLLRLLAKVSLIGQERKLVPQRDLSTRSLEAALFIE